MNRVLTVEEALQRVLAIMEPGPVEHLPLGEALGLALAEDVLTEEAVPPFTNSAMDGFALRAGDTASASPAAPVRLRVIGSLAAGQIYPQELAAGCALRIMTGAPIPVGADAVVPVEHVQAGEDWVEVRRPARPGADIRVAGEDIAEGTRILTAGTTLRAGEIGVLASLGRSWIPVRKRPRVAVITTGDELVDCSERPGPGQIRDSNSHALAAQVQAFGAVPVPFPRVPDTREEVERTFRMAADRCDVILSTGGVSVGDFDHVKTVLEALEAERIFWRVAQKPGGPFGLFRLAGKPCFGLPGNPAAAMVMMEEYVRPALRRRMGHRWLFRPEVEGILEAPWSKNQDDGKVHILRVRARREGGSFRVGLTGPQGSGILTSMMHANALLLMPRDRTSCAAGERVSLHLTDETEDR